MKRRHHADTVDSLAKVAAGEAHPWIVGQPDPLCAICGGSGKARVRAVSTPRGTRALVLSVRLVPSTVRVAIEEGQARRDDRLVACPSCMEADPERAAGVEGKTFVVPPSAARRT